MKWDVIVVGGGSAGCVVAGRLAEREDLSVLLLEAGPDYPDPTQLPDEIKFCSTRTAMHPGSRHNWALRGKITDEQGEIDVAQGKVIGGGSSINGAAMQRGFPEDFDLWAELGNDEWSYEKVLPYFRKSEHDLDIQDEYHGSDGPIPLRRRQAEPWPPIQQAFYNACLEAGFAVASDKNGPMPAGVGVSPSNNIDDVRVSTAMGYLDPVRHHVNLAVRGDVYVRKVLVEDGRAVGVEAESGAEVFRLEAERIVLSAGAVRSPQLLMLSGIGPADDLRRLQISPIVDLPGVGQNLLNHLSAQMTFKVKDGVSLAAHRDSVRFFLHYTGDESAAVNDMMLWTTPIADGRSDRPTGLDGSASAAKAARILCRVGLPDGAGHVRLTSADPGVQPEFNYRYLSHPNDMRRVREAVRTAARLIETDAYRELADGRINPTDEMLSDDEAMDSWIRQTVSTSRHLAGTCKMGPDSDPMAVLDQQCKVKGVRGLWVVDASVMPRIPRSGGVHATVIMIGERVVDWIATG